MDAAKPSCPSADPRSLPSAGHVRYSASTTSPRHPGQVDQSWSPWARRRALGTGGSRACPSTPTLSQRQDGDLEATFGRSTPARPPSPTHTALLGRRAAQVGFAELSHCPPGLGTGPGTLLPYPAFFLPPLLRSPCTSYHDRLSKESLLTLSFTCRPLLLLNSLTHSLVHSLPRPPQLPPAVLSRRHLTTRHVTSVLQQSRLDRYLRSLPVTQDTTHPLCKADHPPSFARPPTNTPLTLFEPQTRTYCSENTERKNKARPLPQEPSQPSS